MARKVDPVVRDQIAARLKLGDDARAIAKEMGVSLSTVYDVRVRDLGLTRKKGTTLQLGNPAEPAGFGSKVAIAMTGEELARLAPEAETMVVAAMVQHDAQSKSLKNRLLKAIVENGPFDDTLSLMRFIRRGPEDAFGTHEVTHILKDSLAGQGLIQYGESRRKGATGRGSVPINIRATSRGYAALGIPIPGKQKQYATTGGHVAGTNRAGHAVGKDMTEQRHHSTVAKGGPIMRMQVPSELWTPSDVPSPKPEPEPAVAAPVQEADAYPILTTLRESFAARARADALASRYADAAALLEKDDPAEAERLMEKAIAASPDTLTDLEKEYLRFAEEHRG